MEDYLPIIEILEDILGEYKNHNDYKGQISFDCPVCSYEVKGLEHGDGKGNLEINYIDNVYKCWSCSETHGTHGNLYKLIKNFGNKKHIKEFNILRPEHKEKKERIFKKISLPKEFIAFTSVSNGFKMTPTYKTAYNYLKKRNITDDIIKKYNIGFCYDGKYANRIIIPSYDKYNNVNYFIARSYLINPKLKYKNPEVNKETLIWNEHLIDWEKTVFLVEGVFDSLFLNNSIPLLGKFITENLFNVLYERAKDIVIILDGDAWEDSINLYHKLNCGKLMGKVRTIRLPIDKDIADLQGEINEFKKKELDNEFK